VDLHRFRASFIINQNAQENRSLATFEARALRINRLGRFSIARLSPICAAAASIVSLARSAARRCGAISAATACATIIAAPITSAVSERIARWGVALSFGRRGWEGIEGCE